MIVCCQSRKNPYLNLPFILCIFTLITVGGLFVGFSVYYNFFDYATKYFVKPNLNTYGAIQLTETTGNLTLPCSLTGCNITGNVNEEKYDYYYIILGGHGLEYVFTAGGDILNFSIVASSNDQLPLYPQDNHYKPITDKQFIVYEWPGSCYSTVILFGVTPKMKGGSYSFNIMTSVRETSVQCGLTLEYLICIIILTAGVLAWIVLVLIWIIYSCRIKGHVLLMDDQEKQRLLVNNNPTNSNL